MFQNYVFSFYNTLADVKLDLESPYLWEKLSVYYGIFDYQVNADTLKQNFYTALTKIKEKNEDKIYFEPNYEDVLLRLFNRKKFKTKNKKLKDIGRLFHILGAQELVLYPQVLELLENLEKEDKQLFLLENGQKSFLKDELRYFGIKGYFKSVYISSDYSLKKPSPKFFNQVISENKLDKKKTLFIGSDFEIDLLPAKKLGFSTCLVQREQTPEFDLKQVDFVIQNGELKSILEF